MRSALAAVAVLLALAPNRAQAVSCAGPYDRFPDGGTLVAPGDGAPLNTLLWVRWWPTYYNPVEVLRLVGPEGDVPIEQVEPPGDQRMVLAPTELLSPNTAYELLGGAAFGPEDVWLGAFQTGTEVLDGPGPEPPMLRDVTTYSDRYDQAVCGVDYADWIELRVDGWSGPDELVLVGLSHDNADPEGLAGTFAFAGDRTIRWDRGDTAWSPNPNVSYPLWIASSDLAGNRTPWERVGTLQMAPAGCTCTSSLAPGRATLAGLLLGLLGLGSRRKARRPGAR